MSSENRSMTLNTLASDVPPLKSNPAGGGFSVKRRFSVQQTQKSFSIMAALSPRRAATARNRSARSLADCCAKLSMGDLRRLTGAARDLPDDISYPIGSVTGVFEQIAFFLAPNNGPKAIHDASVHCMFAYVSQGLEYQGAGLAARWQLFWSNVLNLQLHLSDADTPGSPIA